MHVMYAYVCMHVFISVWVCMYVYIYIWCMYASMHVCMYTYKYIYIYIYFFFLLVFARMIRCGVGWCDISMCLCVYVHVCNAYRYVM